MERFFIGYNLGLRAIFDDGDSLKHVGRLINKQDIINSVLPWYSSLILYCHCGKYLNKHAFNQASNEGTNRKLFVYHVLCSSFSKPFSKGFVKRQWS